MAIAEKQEVLAIIPARSGSKGLPGKNEKLLHGHPLVAWSIAAGLQSRCVTKVLVTTDSKSILDISHRYKAEAPFLRPKEIASDRSTDIEFLTHALQWLKENENYQPDLVVMLRPTSPIRKKGLIDACINRLNEVVEADSLRTVIKAPHTPYKMWKEDGDFLKPILDNPEGIKEPFNAPRQYLPEVLWHVGVVDVIKTKTILDFHSPSGEKIVPFRITKDLAVDIDVLKDFEEAEKNISMLKDIVKPKTKQ